MARSVKVCQKFPVDVSTGSAVLRSARCPLGVAQAQPPAFAAAASDGGATAGRPRVKTSQLALLSPVTRSAAHDANPSVVPSADRTGLSEPDALPAGKDDGTEP